MLNTKPEGLWQIQNHDSRRQQLAIPAVMETMCVRDPSLKHGYHQVEGR